MRQRRLVLWCIGGVLGGVVACSSLDRRSASAPSSPLRPRPAAPVDTEAQPEAKSPAPAEPVGGEQTFLEDVVEGELAAKPQGNTFAPVKANPFVSVDRDRLSTFAVDVDTASYAVARRYINEGNLPPPEAIRVEEFVNYFKYRYPQPETGAFSVHLEGAPSPFTPGHHLLKVGLQGKNVSKSQRKRMNLVFLVDTSGSMSGSDRLPLAQEAIKIAVRNLNEEDTVSLVTYAGSVRDVLPPTPASDQQRIFAAVDSLRSGGGTAMGSGMELAYRHAVRRASGSVVSRVVVMTDGDTNIGPHRSAEAMLEAVRKYVAEGVTLSAIGFGMGNYRDDLMEKLADRGNGNCFYIDSYQEAKKVFETQLVGTLQVIAKDVKVQVELNPEVVATYRLLGYENRDIADRDFRNDRVDAGEIGAGHSVTALYEVQLTGERGDVAAVRVRAKEPSGTEAKEQTFRFGLERIHPALEEASSDFRFAVAVAGTADILRRSSASESWNLATAEKLAQGSLDRRPEREGFLRLLRKARALWAAQHRVASGQ